MALDGIPPVLFSAAAAAASPFHSTLVKVFANGTEVKAAAAVAAKILLQKKKKSTAVSLNGTIRHSLISRSIERYKGIFIDSLLSMWCVCVCVCRGDAPMSFLLPPRTF